jgi:hypothetical protein
MIPAARPWTKAAVLLAVLILPGGACVPKDFEEAAGDDYDGEPFGGVARGGTGSMPRGGSSGTGPGCGDITEVGVCVGDVISYCNDGELAGGDCKSLDPSCVCAFREEEQINDCICGAGGGGNGGSAGAGGMGGTAATGGASATGGSAGTGASGGTSGTGGAAGMAGVGGAGGMCAAPGISCMDQADCCSGSQCVSFDDAAPLCAANCTRNSGCTSGCCTLLSDYSGACGPVSTCGGTGCRPLGASCDTAADCCATSSGTAARCVDVGRGGPRVCSAPCDEPADCSSMCCVRDSTGIQACAPAEICG